MISLEEEAGRVGAWEGKIAQWERLHTNLRLRVIIERGMVRVTGVRKANPLRDLHDQSAERVDDIINVRNAKLDVVSRMIDRVVRELTS